MTRDLCPVTLSHQARSSHCPLPVGSLAHVPWRGYRITKSFGMALIALYAVFTAASVLVELGIV